MSRTVCHRLLSSIFICAVALVAVPAFSLPPTCAGLDACAVAGHQFTEGSWYPFSEDITGNSIVVSQASGWTILQTGCVDNSKNNLMPGTPVSARLLGYLRIEASTAAPGAHYEVQFLIDGIAIGSYLRAYRGLTPQGDHFNAVMPYLSAGNHRFEIQAKLDDPGTLTFSHEFTTSIGSPFSYPAFTQTNSSSFTVTGTWQQASDTVTFSNNTGTTIDIMPQAYFQMNSGTYGHHISFGFSLDGQPSLRTSEIGAPQYYADGINVFDHIANVSPGQHTLSFWLIDRDGGTMSISNRQIEMISFPAATNNGRTDSPLLVDAIADPATPTDVNATSPDHPNFPGTGNTDGGGWTKLLEYSMPATLGIFNYTGEGFVEILSTGSSPATAADIAIEVVAADGGDSDMHWVSLSVPSSQSLPPGQIARSEVYIFADSLGWSDAGETVRLWMRPRTDISTGSTFKVGKRYLGLKLVPVDNTTCYN
jgi:hypothetical protein